jgi:trimeric autotransporter adhesin
MRSRNQATTFHTRAITLAAAILGASGLAAAGDCDPHWDSAIGQSGMNGNVYVLTVFDDGLGSGPALYAGGQFTTAGGQTVNHIAKWDGLQWLPLGSGMSDQVYALTVFDDGSGFGPALYAGGNFITASGETVWNIAKWDGAQWSPLGAGVNWTVFALTVFDDNSGSGPALYAGGLFNAADGQPASHIAKWDGGQWTPLGSGVSGGHVVALTVFDDNSGSGPGLYAGGWFTTAGGQPANRIAKWDGSQWSALGSGVTGGGTPRVLALTVFDDNSGSGPALYAGGVFSFAGGQSALNIAKWDGFQWSQVGGGLSTAFGALNVFDDGAGPALYAGGGFSSHNYIARWNGSQWSQLGSGVNSSVGALRVFDDGSGGGPALYAGGAFTTAGGTPANRIAKWGSIKSAGPADINCDGVVNVSDLLILFDSWGSCSDCDDCTADLNGDCVVNVSDLLILFDNWG